METRSKSKAGTSSAGDDTGIDEPSSMSQLREQLSEQLAASQAAFQVQILQLLGEIRSGSRPATTDHEPEPNFTVPVATEGATTGAIQRFNAPQLEPLSSQVSYHDFLEWRQQWDDLCLLSKLAQFSEPSQLACLRSVLSPEMKRKFKTIGVNPLTDLTPDQFLDKIQAYLRTKRSFLADRFAFNDAHQREHESIDDFLVRLDNLRQSAHLCHEHKTRDECADFTHVSAIIRGIRDVDLRTKLLRIRPFPTLEEAKSILCSEEIAVMNEPNVARPSPPVYAVSTPSAQTPDSCPNCGKNHQRDQTCPAKGKTCDIT